MMPEMHKKDGRVPEVGIVDCWLVWRERKRVGILKQPTMLFLDKNRV
jgi:hypothetical protein